MRSVSYMRQKGEKTIQRIANFVHKALEMLKPKTGQGGVPTCVQKRLPDKNRNCMRSRKQLQLNIWSKIKYTARLIYMQNSGLK